MIRVTGDAFVVEGQDLKDTFRMTLTIKVSKYFVALVYSGVFHVRWKPPELVIATGCLLKLCIEGVPYQYHA